MITCSSCSAQVPDNAKFCPECGAKVQAPSGTACPSCSTPVRAGAKFCPACGAALGGEPIPAAGMTAEAPAPASRRALAPILLPVIIIPALIGIFFLLMYNKDNPQPAAGSMGQQQAGGAPAAGNQPGMGTGMGMEEVFERIDKMKADLQANPKDTTALLGLGQMFEMAAKFSEAEDYYQRFLQVAPGNADVRMALAGVYFNQQKLDKAEAEMQEAVRLRPNYDFALYNLGVIYAAAQKKSEAIKVWHKVMELSPGSELAQKSATNIKSMGE